MSVGLVNSACLFEVQAVTMMSRGMFLLLTILRRADSMLYERLYE